MLENFVNTIHPDNQHRFLNEKKQDSLLIGATNDHFFKLDTQFSANWKEAYIIYRQNIVGEAVITKAYNSQAQDITVEEYDKDGHLIPVINTGNIIDPDTVTSYLITHVTPEETKLLVDFRPCYVQLKLIDFQDNVMYSDAEMLAVKSTLDNPGIDDLLPNDTGEEYGDVYEDDNIIVEEGQ